MTYTPTIVGVVRVRLGDLPDTVRGARGVTLEVDIGHGWPDSDDLHTLGRLGTRFDRVVVVGTDAHALAYTVGYLRDRLTVDTTPVPDPAPF